MSAATTASSAPAFTRTGPSWRRRFESIPIRRLHGFSIAAVAVAAVGAVHARNMSAAPGAGSEEGVLVGRAWTLQSVGSLGRAIDWYDHPPLGLLQVRVWTALTSAFERAPTAVAAGRELMLLAFLASAALLWVLGRRLALDRWATGVALALFGLSPLAVHVHRELALDNLAVPWALAAFALASNPRRPLAAYAASGACIAAALLTSESSVVFVVLLLWHVRRSSLPSTWRYGLVVGGSAFAAAVGATVAYTSVRGSFTGLVDGVRYQFERSWHGSYGSVGARAVDLWFDLDPVGLTLMLVAAPVALVTLPRLRPFAAGVLVFAALAMRPGVVPRSFAAGLLPFGALVVAALAQQAWQRREQLGPAVVLAGAAGVAVAASPWWVTGQRDLLSDDGNVAARAAQRWIEWNVAGDAETSLIVDDAIATDLVQAGIRPERVAGYAALDLPRDVGPPAPGTWTAYDLLVSTEALRTTPATDSPAAAALRHSVVVATFGAGNERVEVRRIDPEATDRFAHDSTTAARQGAALADNPAIDFAPAARRVLVAGEVDERVTTTLVALAVDRPLEVTAFPADPAEPGDVPRRIVALQAGSSADARAVAEVLRAQQAPYRPAHIETGPDGQVTLTYAPAPLI